MREVAAIHLEHLKEAVYSFADRIVQGIDTDIIYGEYLSEFLRHTANNYLQYKGIKIEPVSFTRLFVFLPSNVPMVFFEVLPLLVIYKVPFTFFKLPYFERRLYFSFYSLLKNMYPELGSIFDMWYFSHEEALKEAQNYDFLMIFGSSEAEKIAKNIGKPYRFLGPGFSIGIHGHEDMAKDLLYFDQQGCLSLRITFYFNDEEKKALIEGLKHAHILPESRFLKDRHLYNLYTLLPYGELIYFDEEEFKGIFELKKEKFIDISYPDRILLIKKVDNYRQILEFLGGFKEQIQAIASQKVLPETVRQIAVFTAMPGRLQFQPYNFLFKKGLSFENLFKTE